MLPILDLCLPGGFIDFPNLNDDLEVELTFLLLS
jgi:hypothetical protein